MYWSLACSVCDCAWETGRLSDTPAWKRCWASLRASIGEFDVRVGRVDELRCGLDVEEAVVDVLIDLLDLVGELGFGLLVLRVGDFLLALGLGDLEDGDADLSGGGEGSVGVAGGGADVAVVAGGAGDGILVGLGGGLFRVGGLDLFGVGCEVFAGLQGLHEGGLGIDVVERFEGDEVGETELPDRAEGRWCGRARACLSRGCFLRR